MAHQVCVSNKPRCHDFQVVRQLCLWPCGRQQTLKRSIDTSVMLLDWINTQDVVCVVATCIHTGMMNCWIEDALDMLDEYGCVTWKTATIVQNANHRLPYQLVPDAGDFLKFVGRMVRNFSRVRCISAVIPMVCHEKVISFGSWIYVPLQCSMASRRQ